MDWRKLLFFLPLLLIGKKAVAPTVDPYRSYRGQSALPRGIRNNNPGNLERTGTRWQGMADDQGADPRFIIFTHWVWGVRAILKVLHTYYHSHGLRTPRAVAHRWAPASDGNNPDGYAIYLAKEMGIGPDDVFTFDAHNLERLVRGIIRMENGGQYGSYLTAADFTEARNLA